MADKVDPASSPYLITSTPEGTWRSFAFTPPNSMPSPIYPPTVVSNHHSEQLNANRMRQLSLPADPIAISENAQAPDCSKSLWLDSSSEMQNENSHDGGNIQKHRKQTQSPMFESDNLENMLQKSGVSFANKSEFYTRKPMVAHSPTGQQYSYDMYDHAKTNTPGFQPIGRETERTYIKIKPGTTHNLNPANKKSHVQPGFPDMPHTINGIYDIQDTAINSVRTKKCTSLKSPATSTGGAFVPLHPKPRPKSVPTDCTWVDNRPQYSKKSSCSPHLDQSDSDASGPCPTSKAQLQNKQQLVSSSIKSPGPIKCSVPQELLTASMCMPKSGHQGYQKSAFRLFSHASSFHHGGTSKQSTSHDVKGKGDIPIPSEKLPLREVSLNIKTSPGPGLQSTPARKVLPAVRNESTDSGFDSLHHSTDNFSKSHDELSPAEDYNLDSHKENSSHIKISEVQPEESSGFEKESSGGNIPKPQRKLDIPKRSASPVDPEFRGVMLQMRTKMEQDDKVQLSIRAFFKKSTRLLKKTIGTEENTRTRRDSSSSSDSDCAAELFRKKRRNQAGKQCASCRTKTTPLWRDAEDGTPLCNACGIRYKKYRIRCLSCWHIPRKETKTNLQCTNCGETLRLSLFKTKQWKC